MVSINCSRTLQDRRDLLTLTPAALALPCSPIKGMNVDELTDEGAAVFIDLY